jgi:geranylgeranyl pyrophosphate synthase
MLPTWYDEYKNFIEHAISKYLDTYLSIGMSPSLEKFKEIVRYSFRGGKKLRAIFALEFYLTLSGKKLSDIKAEDDIVKLCIALECIHAFSLVHDDLPCMDNDELRRGELTVWKKYNEYEALLVGDMMNTLGFEIISDIKDVYKSHELAKLVSHSLGFYGVVGGQVEDMYYEKYIAQLDIPLLTQLHYKKTGKLIEASILGGIILSGERSYLDIFRDFGAKIGLAFQIKDDLLDVEGTAEEVGKSVGGEKKWFVYLCGIDESHKRLTKLILECKTIAKNLGSEKIDFLVEYIGNRKK